MYKVLNSIVAKRSGGNPPMVQSTVLDFIKILNPNPKKKTFEKISLDAQLERYEYWTSSELNAAGLN